MDGLNETQLAITPALAPPPGITSNFVNPPSLAVTTDIVGAICLGIASFALTARFITKIYVLGVLKWDDFLAVFAWVCFVPFTGYFMSASKYGAGRHSWDVSLLAFSSIAKVAWVLEVLWPPLMLAAKLSVCVQILNLFAGSKKGAIFWIMQALMAINVLLFGSSFFLILFSCDPREKNWEPDLPGKCINTSALGLASALWNVISDILIWILPLYAVWRLKIPTRKKLGICAIFATAFFAPVSAIFRLFYAIQFAVNSDKVYALQQLGLWSLAETTIYILCGCMPLAPKFIQLVRGRARRRFYDPTPNSLHRSFRFRPRTSADPRFTSKSPWSNPGAMTLKLTGNGGLSQSDETVEGTEQRTERNGAQELQGYEIGIVKTVRIETDRRSITGDDDHGRVEIWV